jgi:hypothetical protein
VSVREERRTYLRRESDRVLRSQLNHAREQAAGEINRELRHKRRRAIRHSCEAKLYIPMGHKDAHSNDWNMSNQAIPARLLDLSTEGCQVFTRNQLDIGAITNLQIYLEAREDIKAVGVVRWTKAVPEKSGFALGIQFTRAEHHAQDAIRTYLSRLDATLGL